MIKEYLCPWCGNKFEENVIYKSHLNPQTQVPEKKSNYSTQVKCPKCCNFLETWKREETGKLVGRKHTHIRR
jgi:DNA-directed RNA polymerase subunit RPC12/RpoP